MELRLDNKVAIVTGASQGIGLAITEGFAADGASVCMAARTGADVRREAERVNRATGRKMLPVQADMSKGEDIKRMIAECTKQFGRIDILVNCGADVPSSSVMETTDAEWDDGIAVKLLGYVRCAREAAKVMMPNKGGVIINIVSISGRELLTASAAPGAVNSAVLNLNKTMADEFAPHGIRVNAVNPGFTDTARMDRHTSAMAALRGMTQEQLKESLLKTIPLRRFGTPVDMANMVRFLSSDAASYITGAVFNVDGGYCRSVF
jgi:NAD(P)-dependent dehydrogenase (short-subunit alcohol dehydrogenase family)